MSGKKATWVRPSKGHVRIYEKRPQNGSPEELRQWVERVHEDAVKACVERSKKYGSKKAGVLRIDKR